MSDYLLAYLGTPGAAVSYSIDNPDKTEHTAATGAGVTAMHVGLTRTLFGVVVSNPPLGGVVNWFEGGAYKSSESITQDDGAIAGDPMTLTAAAKGEIIDAIAGEYSGDTVITHLTRIDASGNIVADPLGEELGVAAPGSTMQAFLASDTARANALRRSVAAAGGTWALSVPTGTLVIRESQDGFYDATEGDSVIEITVVVPA